MTTVETSTRNKVNSAERTPIFCKKTGKLLARVDTAGLAKLVDVPGGAWHWCRDCHMEHHVLWKDINGSH